MQLIIILNYLTCIIFFKSLLLDIIGVKNMEKEIILIILMGLAMGFFLWRQDKKKKDQELSDRLYQAENNITHLNNLNNKRRFK